MFYTPKTGNIKNFSDYETDIFLNGRRKIGLWPVKLKHITSWKDGGEKYIEKDVNDLVKERDYAAPEFFNKKLKWRDEKIVKTKWSLKLNIFWVTLYDECKLKHLFIRMAEVQRD